MQCAAARLIPHAWRQRSGNVVAVQTTNVIDNIVDNFISERFAIKTYRFCTSSSSGPHALVVDQIANDDDCKSDGLFKDFSTSVTFVRPDGRLETKDPNWVADAGFGLLAAGVLGSTEGWSRMNEKDRQQCSENAIQNFRRLNDEHRRVWYAEYCRRLRGRLKRK